MMTQRRTSASTADNPGGGDAPLTPAVLHILLALSDQERHGYGIMREVMAMTRARVQMGPGTLYGTIKRLLTAGLIRESDERPDPELDDERRRYYALTNRGRRTLKAEVARLSDVVEVAQVKLSPRKRGVG